MKIQLARAYTKRMVKKAVRLTEKAILKNLRDTFDRVVLINIPRRDDRLKAALKELTPKRWPFRPPEVFDAMDCFTNRPALYWKDGARAWGRTSDHVMILNKAFNDGVKHLLILDDDFVLTKGFADKIKRFILDCPSDADGYVFGGEHIEKPQEVRTGVVRCHNTQDVLAYSLKTNYLRSLLEVTNNKFKPHGVVMGELQKKWHVYAPDPFLCLQREVPRCPLACSCKRRQASYAPPSGGKFAMAPSVAPDAMEAK